MTKDLNVTIVQTSLAWEDVDANLSHFSKKLEKIESSSTDLIVLPEMFSTGFTMNASKLAEPVNGKTTEWLANMSAQKNCVITGSVVIKDDTKYYNRLIWMQPNGQYQIYNKRHLFRMAEENQTYTAGETKLIIELAGWKICPLVCYDLRFPVWSRQTTEGTYDCLIYVANWPERRSYAWRQLLIARAIENQAYVIGVNRIGKDGTGVDFSGYSVVLTHKGETLRNTQPNEEAVETIQLSYRELENYRKEFPVAMDADKFRIE